jgi:hypothetical protein
MHFATQCIDVFCMVHTIKANYFTDRLDFTMTAESVLCEVHNLPLCTRITQTNAGLQGVKIKCNKLNLFLSATFFGQVRAKDGRLMLSLRCK